MSWPSDKPPWKHVQWHKHDAQLLSESSVAVESSLLLPFPEFNSRLSSLKHQIESLDKVGEWEYLKRTSNPYELVFSQSHDMRIPSSVCSLKPLSRSFFKMVELLHVLDFFKRHTTTIRSAHVCEGPGGFIEALLYVATKKSIQVSNSWAMTLKPSMPNIPGWKRAYTFLRKSPMVTIEYGADETGNIMIPANQAKYLQRSRGKCHIFTADGGFDFSEHYSTQEDEVFPLLVSSSLIGLQTLVKGGDFILKVFDTELKSTNDLLAILACCFDSWTLYKPSLSRPCNAEKYFLGRGCRAIPPWVLRTLTEIQTKNSMSLRHIFPSLPEELSSTLFSRKTEYLEQQIAAVEYAILNNELWNKDQFTIWKSIYQHSVEWCQEFKLPIKAGHQFVV